MSSWHQVEDCLPPATPTDVPVLHDNPIEEVVFNMRRGDLRFQTNPPDSTIYPFALQPDFQPKVEGISRNQFVKLIKECEGVNAELLGIYLALLRNLKKGEELPLIPETSLLPSNLTGKKLSSNEISMLARARRAAIILRGERLKATVRDCNLIATISKCRSLGKQGAFKSLFDSYPRLESVSPLTTIANDDDRACDIVVELQRDAKEAAGLLQEVMLRCRPKMIDLFDRPPSETTNNELKDEFDVLLGFVSAALKNIES